MQPNNEISPINSIKSNIPNTYMNTRDIVSENSSSNRSGAQKHLTPSPEYYLTRHDNISSNLNHDIQNRLSSTATTNESYSTERGHPEDIQARLAIQNALSTQSYNRIGNDIDYEKHMNYHTQDNLRYNQYEDYMIENNRRQQPLKSNLNDDKNENDKILVIDGKEYSDFMDNQTNKSNLHNTTGNTNDGDHAKILITNSHYQQLDTMPMMTTKSNNDHYSSSNSLLNNKKYNTNSGVDDKQFKNVIDFPLQETSKTKKDENKNKVLSSVNSDHSLNANKMKSNDYINTDTNTNSNTNTNTNHSMVNRNVNSNGNGMDNLIQEIRELNDKLKAKQDELSQCLMDLKEKEDKEILMQSEIRNRDIKIEELLKKQNHYMQKMNENTELIKINEQLIEEKGSIRQEIAKAKSIIHEFELENLKLKSKTEELKGNLRKLEDTKSKNENTILNLEKDLNAKDAQIKKYKSKKKQLKKILRNLDEELSEIKKKQCSETPRNNQNELYIANLNDKIRMFLDKINQLNGKIESQNDIMRSKDDKMKNLLISLNELEKIKAIQYEEINILKSDNLSLREENLYLKDQYKRHQMALRNSVMSSIEYNNNTNNKRYKSPTSLRHNNKPDEYDKKIGIEEYNEYDGHNYHHNHLSNTKRLNDEIIRQQGYNSGEKQIYIDEQGRNNNSNYYKDKTFQNDIRSKNSNNERELQNIENSQKRLDFIQSKRIEFEKKRARMQGLDHSPERNGDYPSSYTHGINNKTIQEPYIPQAGSPTLRQKNKEFQSDMALMEKLSVKERDGQYSTKLTNFGMDNEEVFRNQYTVQEEILSPRSIFAKNYGKKPPKVDISGQPNMMKGEILVGQNPNKYINNFPHSVKSERLRSAHRKSQGDATSRNEGYFKFTNSPKLALDRDKSERNSSRKREIHNSSKEYIKSVQGHLFDNFTDSKLQQQFTFFFMILSCLFFIIKS